MKKMMILLPTEIVLEIFSWLPVRSVGRFRTLSKLYDCLLSEPSFVKNHLHHGGGISSPKVLVNITQRGFANETWNFYYPTDNNITFNTLDEISYSSCEVVDGVKLLTNSCNGVFCVEGRKGVLSLWNPTTREATCLPEFPNEKKVPRQFSFGYDSLNEDYKIVGVNFLCKREEGRELIVETNTFMYSHKRGCWKKIEPFPRYCIQASRGIFSRGDKFVNGKIHWIAYTSPDDDWKVQIQCIVSLDIADERYGTVPLPANYRYRHLPGKDINVCVLGGKLCVYIKGRYGSCLEIWMMREYGIEQSWFQLLTIQIPLSGRAICEPLFLMKTGEILLRARGNNFGASIFLYNPKTCNFITVHTLRNCPDHLLLGQIYVESLVKTAITYKGQSILA